MPMSLENLIASSAAPTAPGSATASLFPAPASFPDDYPEHARFVREAEALRDEVLRAGHEPVAAFFTLCLNALRRDGLSGARVRQFEAAMKPVDELFFANFPEDPRFLRELAHAFCAGEGFPSRRLPTDIDDTLLMPEAVLQTVSDKVLPNPSERARLQAARNLRATPAPRG